MIRVYPNTEFWLKQRYLEIKDGKPSKGLNRRVYKEALNCYFSGNYLAAYFLAYIDVITPISINAKRLYRRKKAYEAAFEFKLHNCLQDCSFLQDETKYKLSQEFEFTFRFKKNQSKKVTWGFTKLRNVTIHPENESHYVAITQINYQKYALLLLDLAYKVHEEYDQYLSSSGKQKRKQKERVKYQELSA